MKHRVMHVHNCQGNRFLQFIDRDLHQRKVSLRTFFQCNAKLVDLRFSVILSDVFSLHRLMVIATGIKRYSFLFKKIETWQLSPCLWPSKMLFLSYYVALEIDQTIFYRLFFEIFRYVEIIRIYLFIILHEFSTTSLDTQTLINNLK